MRGKLCLAIAVTAMLVIVIMAGMVGISFREGLTHYILAADMDRLRPVKTALTEDYDEEAGGWPQFDGTPIGFLEYVRMELDPFRPDRLTASAPVGGMPSDVKIGDGPVQPATDDPLGIGPRTFLLDADRNLVGGAPGLVEGALIEPIIVNRGEAGEAVVGYFGVRSPNEGRTLADSIYLCGQFRTLGWASLFALIASTLFATFLSKQLIAPLQMLAGSTRRLANGDYGIQLRSARTDEVGELIKDFNLLARNLERAAKAEKQWISDTSHELKTPLSILRAEIEALQDGVRLAGQGTYATLHCAVMRVSELVEALSLLSYAREEKLVQKIENQDISRIVGETTKMTRSVMEDAGLTLDVSIQSGVIGDVDPMRIRQMIGNLLENSRRYTEAPGTVQIRLTRSDHEIVLTVADSAPSPPKDNLKRLFDRFYRVEETHSHALGSVGLGLAVCQAIVKDHGGAITAEISGLGGLGVTVRIPIKMKRAMPSSVPRDQAIQVTLTATGTRDLRRRNPFKSDRHTRLFSRR